MTILIVQGIMGFAAWQPWLNDELTARGHTVIMPKLPNDQHPDRAEWLAALQTAIATVHPSELIIIGHSLGVTSALDFIAQIPSPVRGLISVAGFANDYGDELNSYFLSERHLDVSNIKKNVQKAVVFYGDDDPWVTREALQEVADGLDAETHIILRGGHLSRDAGYTTFPALIDVVEGMSS